MAGKTASLAGGSSGTNLGIAERMSALGACVTLISRSEERVITAAKGIVRDDEAIEGAFADAVTVFLASETDKFVTGAIMDCGGGLILGEASGDALIRNLSAAV